MCIYNSENTSAEGIHIKLKQTEKYPVLHSVYSLCQFVFLQLFFPFCITLFCGLCSLLLIPCLSFSFYSLSVFILLPIPHSLPLPSPPPNSFCFSHSFLPFLQLLFFCPALRFSFNLSQFPFPLQCLVHPLALASYPSKDKDLTNHVIFSSQRLIPLALHLYIFF